MKYLTLFTFLVVLTQLFGQGGTSCYLSSALVMDHKITITHITADSLPCGVSGKYPLKKRRNYTFFYYNDRCVYLDMKKADDEMLTVLIQNYEPPEFPGYMPTWRFCLTQTGLLWKEGLPGARTMMSLPNKSLVKPEPPIFTLLRLWFTVNRYLLCKLSSLRFQILGRLKRFTVSFKFR